MSITGSNQSRPAHGRLVTIFGVLLLFVGGALAAESARSLLFTPSPAPPTGAGPATGKGDAPNGADSLQAQPADKQNQARVAHERYGAVCLCLGLTSLVVAITWLRSGRRLAPSSGPRCRSPIITRWSSRLAAGLALACLSLALVALCTPLGLPRNSSDVFVDRTAEKLATERESTFEKARRAQAQLEAAEQRARERGQVRIDDIPDEQKRDEIRRQMMADQVEIAKSRDELRSAEADAERLGRNTSLVTEANRTPILVRLLWTFGPVDGYGYVWDVLRGLLLLSLLVWGCAAVVGRIAAGAAAEREAEALLRTTRVERTNEAVPDICGVCRANKPDSGPGRVLGAGDGYCNSCQQYVCPKCAKAKKGLGALQLFCCPRCDGILGSSKT